MIKLSVTPYVHTISVKSPPSRMIVVGLNLTATVTEPPPEEAAKFVAATWVDGAETELAAATGDSDLEATEFRYTFEQYITSSINTAKNGVNLNFAESMVIPIEESSAFFPSARVKVWWIEITSGGRGNDSCDGKGLLGGAGEWNGELVDLGDLSPLNDALAFSVEYGSSCSCCKDN